MCKVSASCTLSIFTLYDERVIQISLCQHPPTNKMLRLFIFFGCHVIVLLQSKLKTVPYRIV